MVAWLSSLDSKIQTALIAGITAACVSGVFATFSTYLKDFLAPALIRRLERQRSSKEVFRKYAEPLSAAATSLFWRLKETLAKDGRGYYLSAREPRSEFERYKLLSTYYRLAAFLGCVRALQRELLYFRIEQKRISAIEQALIDFEKALADGHEVELRRLEGLLSLWNAKLRDAKNEVHLAVDIERVKRVWMSRRSETRGDQLTRKDQKVLVRLIADLMNPYINTEVNTSLQEETLTQAMRWLFIKQAWLYRDWQSAIGDLILEKAGAGERTFDIIGFNKFESMASNPTGEQYRCLARIACIFDELNTEKDDPFDARSIMVAKIYRATAALTQDLAETPYSRYLIPLNTYEEVRTVIKNA